MASSSLAMRAAAARPGLATSLRAPTARAFSSRSHVAARRPALHQTAKQHAVTRQVRRSSDEAPRRKPGAVRLTFRWLWRLTYLSVLGYAGYVGWNIYYDRNPPPQNPPDPNKKTLVILGMFLSRRWVNDTGRAQGNRPMDS